MKISELIKQLQAAQAEHGDLDVEALSECVPCEWYSVDGVKLVPANGSYPAYFKIDS